MNSFYIEEFESQYEPDLDEDTERLKYDQDFIGDSEWCCYMPGDEQ